jgi:polyisoprenoid-binding protein YceI
MESMKWIRITTLSAILAWIPLAATWNADAENAKILFSISGPFGIVHGNFMGLKATLKFDETDLPGSSISASVDANTVSTGIGLRNHDLKKEEWLNTDKYPLISYRSAKIEKTSTGFKSLGELTLKGVAKPLEIPFIFTSKGNTGLFKGQFVIKRQDFNLVSTSKSVGDEITITLEVPVKK